MVDSLDKKRRQATHIPTHSSRMDNTYIKQKDDYVLTLLIGYVDHVFIVQVLYLEVFHGLSKKYFFKFSTCYVHITEGGVFFFL